MFERILVPLDGSPLAESILSQVRRILLHHDSEVVLLRSAALPPLDEGDVSALLIALERDADGYLRGQQLKLAEKGARVRTLVRTGPPADAILDAAGREKATLIAMTTHGRTGFSRWTFGSVAEKVVRASPIPVLLIRSFTPDASGIVKPAGPGELRVRTILVPIDLSDLSMNVVPFVAEWAKLFQAKVLLLNVCGKEVACDVPVVPMTRAFERLRKDGIAAEPLMRQGDPADQILEACLEHSVDLVAMTTHGRSGMSRWALGSVAEKVLRHATVPMLIIRGVRPDPPP
jgi:nucleotide-binding universal stress UspA family protein